MIRILQILVAIQISLSANALSVVKYADSYDNINTISKATKLSNITYKTLSANSKVENIQDLLSLAVKENKLGYTEQFKYRGLYQSMENGDKILLKCLKHTSCNINNYSKIMTNSSLHRQVALQSPSMNLATANHAVGAINENIMNKYFKSQGWTKIEGEVGRNGIDGLYIKKNKDGIIRDVLVAESKYNRSGLQHTNNGKQMSNQWVLKKIKDLEVKYPNNHDYYVIEQYVNNNIYRSLLWNLKVQDDNLVISLKKIHDKEGIVSAEKLKGSEMMKINYNGNQNISINNPETAFHKQIISWYKDEIDKY